MAGKQQPFQSLSRVDRNRVHIQNPYHVPATLFAQEEVPVEADGIAQFLQFLSLQHTAQRISKAQKDGTIPGYWGHVPGEIERVVLTPDFHKGGGIPVGTVAKTRGMLIPQAVGNDICCGMRLLVTDLTREQLEPHLDSLEKTLRGIFFEGKRDIPMSPKQREALLRDGLWGLHQTAYENQGKGLWRFYHPDVQERDLERVHFNGVLPTDGLFGFGDFVKASGKHSGYDSQIGSVGGGNHFVEVQVVEELMDGDIAHAWGIKPDRVAIMIHTGSVGLGHMVGSHFRDIARSIYPKSLKHPKHGFYFLPTTGPHAKQAAAYLSAMGNAANFAFGNRLFLGLMTLRALSEVCGHQVQGDLIYDVPHNLIWKVPGEDETFVHRKGACPAFGPNPDLAGPFQYTGDPVIIPGSMGDSSFLLAGNGKEAALQSACHGAGRSLARGQARKVEASVYQETFQPLRVVTPIDPKCPKVRSRQDILTKYHQHMKEEAPYAYKPVTAVIETVTDAGIASKVARMWPLLTVKG